MSQVRSYANGKQKYPKFTSQLSHSLTWPIRGKIPAICPQILQVNPPNFDLIFMAKPLTIKVTCYGVYGLRSRSRKLSTLDIYKALPKLHQSWKIIPQSWNLHTKTENRISKLEISYQSYKIPHQNGTIHLKAEKFNKFNKTMKSSMKSTIIKSYVD